MNDTNPHSNEDARRWAWLGLLTAASVVLSLPFSCVAPFAALVALGGLNMERRDAFLLAAGVFIANQAVGFGILGYSFKTSTILWGIAMGIGALIAAWAALEAAHLTRAKAPALRIAFTFASAFIAWEAVMAVTRLFLSESGHVIDPNLTGRILAINAGCFVLLLGLQFLTERAGIAPHRKPAPHA